MDTQMLITSLAWGLVAMGGALIGSLLWFARRSVAQLDSIQRMLQRMLLRLAVLEARAGIHVKEPEDAEGS